MHLPILSITVALVLGGLTTAEKEQDHRSLQQVDLASKAGISAAQVEPDTTRDAWNDSMVQSRGLDGPDLDSNQTPIIESDELLEQLSQYPPEESDWFGYSVAISGDGLTALVGAPLRDEVIYECQDPADEDCEETVEYNCGSVTVYQRTVITNPWTPIEVLLPLPTDYEEENRTSLANIEFGHSVAISDDGTLAIVGAPYYTNYWDDINDVEVENAFNCGTAYVYQRVSGGARFGDAVHQFLPFNDEGDPNETGDDYNDTAFDWFGWSVSIYKYPDPPPRVPNPRAIVGSPNDLSILEDNLKPGSIYIYDSSSQNGAGFDPWPDEPDDPRWVKFVQDDGYEFTNDLFGHSVWIDREYAIAGAPQHAKVGVGIDSGAAFVYRQRNPPNNMTWELDEELIPDVPEQGHDQLETGDEFGWSVSISRAVDPLGATPDTFRALVGSPHDEYGACCFELSCEDNYDQQDCIDAGGTYLGGFSECSGACSTGLSSERGPCCFEGACVDFLAAIDCANSGGTPMPGFATCAEAEELCGYVGLDRGSAWVFRRADSGWFVEQKIYPDDGVTDDWFGYSVSLNDDAAVVGANRAIEWAWDEFYNTYRNVEVGSAYYFHTDPAGQEWERVNKLLSEYPEWGEEFGRAVAISEEDTATDEYGGLVGAPYHADLWDDEGDFIEEIYNTGAAFEFILEDPDP